MIQCTVSVRCTATVVVQTGLPFIIVTAQQVLTIGRGRRTVRRRRRVRSFPAVQRRTGMRSERNTPAEEWSRWARVRTQSKLGPSTVSCCESTRGSYPCARARVKPVNPGNAEDPIRARDVVYIALLFTASAAVYTQLRRSIIRLRFTCVAYENGDCSYANEINGRIKSLINDRMMYSRVKTATPCCSNKIFILRTLRKTSFRRERSSYVKRRFLTAGCEFNRIFFSERVPRRWRTGVYRRSVLARVNEEIPIRVHGCTKPIIIIVILMPE